MTLGSALWLASLLVACGSLVRNEIYDHAPSPKALVVRFASDPTLLRDQFTDFLEGKGYVVFTDEGITQARASCSGGDDSCAEVDVGYAVHGNQVHISGITVVVKKWGVAAPIAKYRWSMTLQGLLPNDMFEQLYVDFLQPVFSVAGEHGPGSK